MIIARNQRWRHRIATFKPAATFINPDHYRAEPINRETAAAFLAKHHYLATCPVPQQIAGYFRKTGPCSPTELVGVALFSVPATNAVLTKYTGLPPASATTLSRFILLDDVEGNGESAFIAQARRILRQNRPDLEGFASFADPRAGHYGAIYQASSALCLGTTRPRLRWTTPSGVVPDRTLNKITGMERGHQPAMTRLIQQGVLSRNRRKFRQPINVACPAPGRWGRPNSRVTSRHFDHGNASRTSRPDCSGLDEAD